MQKLSGVTVIACNFKKSFSVLGMFICSNFFNKEAVLEPDQKLYTVPNLHRHK